MRQLFSKQSWFKKLALWLSALVIVLLIVISVLLAGAANPVLNAHLKEISTQITKSIGRKIEIQSIDLKVLPSFVFHLTDVKLGETKESTWAEKRTTLNQQGQQIKYPHDTMHMRSIDIRFNVWKALVSGGQELKVDSMKIDGLYVNLHRDATGKFNLQDPVVQSEVEPSKSDPNKTPKEAQKAQKVMTPEELRNILKAIDLNNVAIQDVHIMLVDEQAHQGDVKGEPAVTHVIELVKADLTFPVLELTRQIDLQLKAKFWGEDNIFQTNVVIGPFDQWLSSSEFDAYLNHMNQLNQVNQGKKESLEDTQPSNDETSESKEGETGLLIPKKWRQFLPETIEYQTDDTHQSHTLRFSLAQAQNPPHRDSDRNTQTSLNSNEPPSTKVSSIKSIQVPFPISFTIQSKNLTFAKLAPYLPATLGAKFDQAKLEGDLSFKLLPHKGVTSGGRMEFSGVQLQQNKSRTNPKWAKPLVLSFSPNANIDIEKQKITLSDFTVSLNQMSIHLNGSIEQLDQKVPYLNQFRLHTKKLNLGKILQLLPPVAQALPPKTKITGAISIQLESQTVGTMQAIESHVDLNQLLFHMPNVIYKDAGVPLSIKLNSKLSKSRIDLKNLQVQLSDLDLNVKGKILPLKKDVNLSAKIAPFQINRLMRMMPSVHQSIPKDFKIKGKAALDFSLNLKGKHIDTHSSLSLEGARLQTPDVRLLGDGAINFKLKGDPSTQFQAQADSTLATLDIKAGDAFEKPKGVPLDFKVKVSKQGKQMKIPLFNFNVANIKIQGKAKQNAQGKVVLNSKLPLTDLQPLLALLPSMKDAAPGLKQGKVAFDFQFNVNPNALQSLSLDLKSFKFKSPKNNVTGNFSIQNPSKPVIRFNLNAPLLSLSELTSSHGNSDTKSQKSSSGKSKPFVMPKIDFIGKMKIIKGEANGILFDHFEADIHLQKQVLELKKMQVNVFKGSMKFHPLVISMPTGKKSYFNGEMKAKNIQVASFMSQVLDKPKTLSSEMSGSFRLKGQGNTWKSMMPVTNGGGDLTLQKTQFNTFDLQNQILGSLGKKVKKLFKRKRGKKFAFSNFLAQTKIKAGKITFQKDLALKTPEGPIILNGYSNLNGKLNFKAQWQLTPKAVGRWIGKKIKRKKPINVIFLLKGTLSKPKVKKVDASVLTKVILKAYGLGKVGKAMDAVGDLLGGKKKKNRKKRKKRKKKKRKKKGN